MTKFNVVHNIIVLRVLQRKIELHDAPVILQLIVVLLKNKLYRKNPATRMRRFHAAKLLIKARHRNAMFQGMGAKLELIFKLNYYKTCHFRVSISSVFK